MAILTKTGMDKILRRIMETGTLTEDMERDIDRIRSDFDEREGMLRRYGETYDGEDMDEYEWRGRDDESREDSDRDDKDIYTPREEAKDYEDWRGRYEEMRQRYLDRFFGGRDEGEEYRENMRETEEDVRRDGEPQTFDELLERTEG
jgi:hypothetical protein